MSEEHALLSAYGISDQDFFITWTNSRLDFSLRKQCKGGYLLHVTNFKKKKIVFIPIIPFSVKLIENQKSNWLTIYAARIGKIGEARLVKDEPFSGPTPPLKYSRGWEGGLRLTGGRRKGRTVPEDGRILSASFLLPVPAIRLASLERGRGYGRDCGREKGGKRRGEAIVTLNDNRRGQSGHLIESIDRFATFF